MGQLKGFLAGFVACFLAVACVSAQFPYHYYPYDIKNHTLLGPTEKDDVSDQACSATAADAYPCTCLFSPEFFKLKADLLKSQSDLIACQRGEPPSS